VNVQWDELYVRILDPQNGLLLREHVRYEWVSRCCKARTLPHLLAFVACTIRTWSRRTLRWMA